MKILYFLWRLIPGVVAREQAFRLTEIIHWLTEIAKRLDTVEKKAEATRQKVYRDNGSEAEQVIAGGEVKSSPASANPLASLRAGELVPDDILKYL